MKVFLVRHGTTEEHEKKRIQRFDSVLSERGKKQTEALAKRSRFNIVDLIVCSESPRAKQTAEILAKNLNKPLELFRGIHETEIHPKRHGKKFESNINKDYYDNLHKNYDNLDWKHKGKGESLKDVINRASKFKKHLEEKHHVQNLLVVSHAIFMGCFVTLCLLGENYEDAVYLKVFRSLRFANTGISLLIYDEKKKAWKMGYINDHSHLANV